MGSKSEPPYKVGESWEEFLARRGIDRDKDEPIHEIQWLRSERIRLMVEVERLQQERQPKGELKLYVWYGFQPGWSGGLAFALARTASEARVSVQKEYGDKVSTWGTLRVHRVEAGRAGAVAGGG